MGISSFPTSDPEPGSLSLRRRRPWTLVHRTPRFASTIRPAPAVASCLREAGAQRQWLDSDKVTWHAAAPLSLFLLDWCPVDDWYQPANANTCPDPLPLRTGESQSFGPPTTCGICCGSLWGCSSKSDCQPVSHFCPECWPIPLCQACRMQAWLGKRHCRRVGRVGCRTRTVIGGS